MADDVHMPPRQRDRLLCPCGHTVTSKHAARHRRTCVPYNRQLVKEQYESELTAFKLELCELRQSLPSEVAVLQSENARLRAELQQRACQPRQIIINNSTVTINVVPYGKEPPLPNETVQQIIAHPTTSVPRYIEAKHFEREGCANLRLANSKFIEMVEEDKDGNPKWVYKDKVAVLHELQHDALNTLIDNYNAEENTFWRAWYMQNQLDHSTYADKKEWRRNVRNLEAVLLNNKRARRD